MKVAGEYLFKQWVTFSSGNLENIDPANDPLTCVW